MVGINQKFGPLQHASCGCLEITAYIISFCFCFPPVEHTKRSPMAKLDNCKQLWLTKGNRKGSSVLLIVKKFVLQIPGVACCAHEMRLSCLSDTNGNHSKIQGGVERGSNWKPDSYLDLRISRNVYTVRAEITERKERKSFYGDNNNHSYWRWTKESDRVQEMKVVNLTWHFVKLFHWYFSPWWVRDGPFL